MTNAYRSGNEDFKPKVEALRPVIDQAFDKLLAEQDYLNSELGDSDQYVEHSPKNLKRVWDNLKERAFTDPAPQIFAEHTALMMRIIMHMTHISDLSNMTLDPDLDTFYLMTLTVDDLPNTTELLGRARGLASGVAAKGSMSPDQRANLTVLIDRVNSYTKNLKMNIQTVFTQNPEARARLQTLSTEAIEALTGFLEMINTRMLDSENIQLESGQVFGGGTTAIDKVFKLYDAMLPTTDEILQQRIEQAQIDTNISLLTVAVVLLLVGYLFIAFYLAIMRTINALHGATTRLADGDLSVRIEKLSRDELSSVVDGFNTMAESFGTLVGKVLDSTTQLTTAAEQMTAITGETTLGVSRQRSETEQVATAINEMSATVQEVAGNASAAAEASEHANQAAQDGRKVVMQTVDSINKLAKEVEQAAQTIRELQKDSANIGSVLDVIKSIAEQTNLLALNAAIEAARAGEQGRGFAVVADEVRTLASRTASSTREIEEMIIKLQEAAERSVGAMEKGRAMTQESVAQASAAGAALGEITSAVGVISDMNTQIASASVEQGAVTDEINRNISNISEISEQTALGANQTQEASEALAHLAVSLQTQVRHFRI
jgi:methyl-accepting chemotaxis protein